MAKKKDIKTMERVVEDHPDVVMTDEDKKALAEKRKKEAEARLRRIQEKREELRREACAPERRAAQAKALWMMYERGELVRQTIMYESAVGTIKQDVLFSHKSIYAV